MALSVSTLCVWQAFTLGTRAPPEAQKLGFVRWDQDLHDLHLARFFDPVDHTLAWAWLQSNDGVGHRTYKGRSQFVRGEKGEILVCPNITDVRLRWMKFAEVTNIGRCVQIGDNEKKEPILVGRFASPISVICKGSDKYAMLPVGYVPSEGYAMTEFCGPNASSDVDIFCSDD